MEISNWDPEHRKLDFKLTDVMMVTNILWKFTEGVEASGSKKFSMASKKMFKVSEGFYIIRALQRTLNQDHRRRRKKDTQEKLIF